MSCVQYIKDKLGGEYQKILLKLLDDNKLSNKELEWFGDNKKVGKLSTIVNEFYNLWNKGWHKTFMRIFINWAKNSKCDTKNIRGVNTPLIYP